MRLYTNKNKCVIVRPGVIVTITTVQVIVLVIDETERNVIAIESKVIVIELLLCYYIEHFNHT